MDPAAGAIVRAALEVFSRPHPTTASDAGGDGQQQLVGDDRTAAQRRADALATMARAESQPIAIRSSLAGRTLGKTRGYQYEGTCNLRCLCSGIPSGRLGSPIGAAGSLPAVPDQRHAGGSGLHWPTSPREDPPGHTHVSHLVRGCGPSGRETAQSWCPPGIRLLWPRTGRAASVAGHG